MSKTKGRVTLPSESNFLNETKEMLDRWGADALRDSDGTKLDALQKHWTPRFILLILLREDTMNSRRSIWMNASKCFLCLSIM